MKKKGMTIFIILLLLIGVVGCKSKDNKEKENNKVINTSVNEDLKIDGVYIASKESDSNFKKLLIFYTVKPKNKDIKLASNSLTLVIGENEYKSIVSLDTPNLTRYYHSEIVKPIYVGNEEMMASLFCVPSELLSNDKNMKISDKDAIFKGIKLNTKDIKTLDTYEDISLDIDNEYANKRLKLEQAKQSKIDKSLEDKIKKDLIKNNLNFESRMGITVVKYKLSFNSSNRFKMKSNISGTAIDVGGKYTIRKGYIILTCDKTNRIIRIPYVYSNNELNCTSPFYDEENDLIF